MGSSNFYHNSIHSSPAAFANLRAGCASHVCVCVCVCVCVLINLCKTIYILNYAIVCKTLILVQTYFHVIHFHKLKPTRKRNALLAAISVCTRDTENCIYHLTGNISQRLKTMEDKWLHFIVSSFPGKYLGTPVRISDLSYLSHWA